MTRGGRVQRFLASRKHIRKTNMKKEKKCAGEMGHWGKQKKVKVCAKKTRNRREVMRSEGSLAPDPLRRRKGQPKRKG